MTIGRRGFVQRALAVMVSSVVARPVDAQLVRTPDERWFLDEDFAPTQLEFLSRETLVNGAVLESRTRGNSVAGADDGYELLWINGVRVVRDNNGPITGIKQNGCVTRYSVLA